MSEVSVYMTAKHREIDHKFIDAERAVAQNNWVEANRLWDEFSRELDLHMRAEEAILFPEFEQETGMTNGPTMILKLEHRQIYSLISKLKQSLQKQNRIEYQNFYKLLAKLMHQHNTREEQIIYPLSAQTLPDTGVIIDRIEQLYHSNGIEPSLSQQAGKTK